MNLKCFYCFSDIMNSPALSLNKVERVGRIVEILRNETFCGFPVVNAKGRVRKILIIFFVVAYFVIIPPTNKFWGSI